MKILSFAASNNSKSINYQLVNFVSSLLADIEVTVLDIRQWKVPMYSIDLDGTQAPARIVELISLIKEHDGFIISSPEHNGGTPAFFKNILDWLSRVEKNVFEGKPVFLMSTSPGGGGGATHLKYLIHSMPFQGAKVAATFSLPSFFENFKEGGIVDAHLGELKESIGEFYEAL